MNKNIFEIVEEVLKTNSKYISDDGKLLKAMVYSDVMTMDKELLCLLLSNAKIKERFFKDVNGTLIFDKQGFAWFIESKEFLPDSYTRYTNKIGLTNGGDFISKSNDVVLDFPYKDCVLEGGQDKEDQKRKEIFYNETIASDEISKMLAPKVFTNAKRYTKDGVEENITFDENDNLIIKGNNLIALSSLLKRYEGKVKCIYIDPPYNTGSDSFNYNDAFNHSSWLVFMKNRLEIAKKLLSDTGSIFIQIDSFEQAYLKVIMDELFGRENFRNAITWKRRGGSANPSNQLNNVVEWILWYSKDSATMEYKPVFSLNDDNTQKYIKERFTFVDEHGRKYMKSPIQSPNYRENLIYDYKGYKTPAKGYSISREVMEQWDKEGKLAFPDSKDKNINRKIFLDEYKGQPINSLWSDIFVINPMSSERIEFGAGQKPEALIERIFSMVTNEGDIVLDYHLGSGTTCAVAHKMRRRYIGVEQMDYIEDITVERMKKVIEGEQTGISKTVDWQGGGSFIYCELLENASTLIKKIQAASEETISEIKNEIYADERIVPYITREELEKADEEFHSLELEEKKKVLISLVDKNKLYINYSDMDDESYDISESDKAFTKSFYAEV
ncbi:MULTISPECIES: DNA methyltransferase [Streptococcus]|jgi:methyltransferase|uniref:DNA methyltransferase n=1 Tax=Streptococcus TaxID=1301 RepID=UPI0004482F29|nr:MULTISPECIES: site-specific DNA-methyltransferase [Streptococcus]EUC76745.1 DNA methylase family protein [Streptococcus sp. CM7]MBT3137573.1 site-specific DNA-methyltransferase [Streptococcus parasanguinis]OFL61673.1 cytosine methyltransferase [Streptococcus sp. HMSC061D01]